MTQSIAQHLTKRAFSRGFAAAALAVLMLTAHSVEAASLVSYWSFDESASGTGTALDQIDGNDGTFGGTVTRTTGLIGVGAAQFSHNNGINVGTGTGGNFSVTDGIAIEMLIKPGANLDDLRFEEVFRKEDGGNRILFSFQEHGTILSLGLNIGGYGELDMPINNGANNGDHRVYLDDPGGLGPEDVVLRDGNTHHIVGTYDEASGLKAIYVDGFLAHSQNFAPGTAIVSGGGTPAYIGATNGRGEPFHGIIDEVAFYDSGLTGGEVAAHYANVQAGRNYFTDIPEPSTLMLAALGLLGLIGLGRRRKRS